MLKTVYNTDMIFFCQILLSKIYLPFYLKLLEISIFFAQHLVLVSNHNPTCKDNRGFKYSLVMKSVEKEEESHGFHTLNKVSFTACILTI